MRFQYDNHEYSISFNRAHRQVTRFDGTVVTSKFPYTSISIDKLVEAGAGAHKVWESIRSAIVGALPSEDFTFEQGRLAALRSVSRTLDKPFKKAMWKAYTSRPRS